jgi:hypothetical protein
VTQDLSGYTVEYYQRHQAEYWFKKHGLLRPDELAALCYTFGMPFSGHEAYAFRGTPWPREPHLIMSIGAGAGVLEKALEDMGLAVIGVDPSPGAKVLYQGSRLQDDTTGIEACDTIIFCESLEHIPLEQIRDIWSRINHERFTRVIVVNWPGMFPIPVASDGWDHITRLDDALYDELSEGFNNTVLRWGSHLVLER